MGLVVSVWSRSLVKICICHDVSDSTIRTLAESGNTQEQIITMTQAGTCCGVCAEDVAQLVKEVNFEQI